MRAGEAVEGLMEDDVFWLSLKKESGISVLAESWLEPLSQVGPSFAFLTLLLFYHE